MRIFFVTVIIILNIQSWSIADDIVIEELFGVKILDDINKYANKTNGVKQEHLKGIITFEDETLNINRDKDFDTYYLRTDNDYKIHNITARKIFVSEFDNFNNDCLNQKSTMVNMLSKFFDIKENKFVNYSWLDPRTKALYDDSTLKYKDENISLILSKISSFVNAFSCT